MSDPFPSLPVDPRAVAPQACSPLPCDSLPAAESVNPDRRSFMTTAAKGLLGVSFAGAVSSRAAHLLGADANVAAAVQNGRAKHVIMLFMNGAMSHLDTFDPKPGTPEGGETKVIQTRVPGIAFSEYLPRLAYLAGGLAVVRSMSTETGAHEQGRYLMRTAYKKLNSIQHPGLGAWMAHLKGRENKELPGNVFIGSDNSHPGAGFLPPNLSPVPIANPALGLQNTKLPSYLTESNFNRRLALVNRLDGSFRTKYAGKQVEAYNEMYTEARRLMGSDSLKVFDIKEEPEKIREAYGNNSLGQGCLLARRLVQDGVRFVEVNYGGWDMHQTLWDRVPEHAGNLDVAMGNLLRDLHSKGLLSETLVVLQTEFGRSPKINENAGRDHHPGAFSCVLAGAGIRGGQVYGASDKRGFSVETDHCSVAAFHATIAAAAGIDYDEEHFAPNGRPFKVGGGAQPISQLLA